MLQSRDICLLVHYNYKWSVSSKSVQIKSDPVKQINWIANDSRLYLNPGIIILFIIPKKNIHVSREISFIYDFWFGGEVHKNLEFILPQMVRAFILLCTDKKMFCLFVYFGIKKTLCFLAKRERGIFISPKNQFPSIVIYGLVKNQYLLCPLPTGI